MTAEIIGAWLQVWDRRLHQQQLRDDSWRDGWQAAEMHLGDRYEAGYNDARMALKTAQHTVIRLARDEAAIAKADEIRWGPGGRQAFGQPREGDYAGGPVQPW
jgi:hypothetical protein